MRLYTIDLTLPPRERWNGVHKTPIRKLVHDAEQALYELYTPTQMRLATLAAACLRGTYRRSPFVQEISGLAEHAGVSADKLMLLNISYDLASCALRIPGMHGCTGALMRDPKSREISIVRTMDWAFPESIHKYTTLYRYTHEDFEVLTVGFPGFVGVVSGLNSAGVALTLNQAFVERTPSNAYPVPWLVRDVLTHNDTFDAALADITTTRAASGGFYLLTDGSQGALIESTGDTDTVHMLAEHEAHLTVANHFSDEVPDPDAPREWGDSFARQHAIAARVKYCSPRNLLQTPMITHAATAHQLHIQPAQGNLEVRCPSSAFPQWQAYRTN